jgi:hypothetical protein
MRTHGTYLIDEKLGLHDSARQYVREEVIAYLLRHLKNSKPNVVTLPSSGWAFERALIRLAPQTRFLAFEHSNKIWRDVVTNMPGRHRSDRLPLPHAGNVSIGHTSDRGVLVRGDIVEAAQRLHARYTRTGEIPSFLKYNCAWFDLCSSLYPGYVQFLHTFHTFFGRSKKVQIPIVFTLAKGRESRVFAEHSGINFKGLGTEGRLEWMCSEIRKSCRRWNADARQHGCYFHWEQPEYLDFKTRQQPMCLLAGILRRDQL